jgi:hypothetical protein
VNLFLSPDECKLPIDEIEAWLIARDAPADTTLYQAHYYPTWLVPSTISVLINQEISTLSLYIWSQPSFVDASIARQTRQNSDPYATLMTMPDKPMFIEEHIELSRNKAFYFDSNLQRLNVFELPPPTPVIGVDGITVDADIMILNQRKHHFSMWGPTDKHLQYFWGLCYLAMECLEEKRSLKYLIALTRWLIG